MTQLGIHQISVPPSYSSTEYHCHRYEEEAVYVFSVTGMATLGNRKQPIRPGLHRLPPSTAWSMISTLYYERLLASQDKSPVAQEAKQSTQPLAESAKDYLRDPYILDFLNLQDKTYQESQLEQAIISNLQQF
ncbi:hypothetical protein HVA01_21790 [Halovibrio variabilis]|uniref:Uncharacterized protein n=1 Tax=Halovibrio variabilis TaxID=31910 RepID=A0A511USS8_9GAMM|nr:hypothetical protein [Halovibrio variabilis]GEN28533.1 hypothetical protein HVA01_21790 [Halovibrio variabilis]